MIEQELAGQAGQHVVTFVAGDGVGAALAVLIGDVDTAEKSIDQIDEFEEWPEGVYNWLTEFIPLRINPPKPRSSALRGVANSGHGVPRRKLSYTLAYTSMPHFRAVRCIALHSTRPATAIGRCVKKA